jgi:hypothetical protein
MTEKPTVVEALAAVMGDVRAVGKDQRNNDQHYNFRGIDAVINAVGPALRRHGVVVMPELLEANYRDVQTSRGKPSRECTVKVRYTFYGPAGDKLECVTPGESMDFGDKGAPKAMSVAYRIALIQALALPTDEPDPDQDNYERAPDPAEDARQELLAAVQERKLDIIAVRKAFARQYGTPVASAAAEQLRAFTAALLADPGHVLAAVNGQPASGANGHPVGVS